MLILRVSASDKLLLVHYLLKHDKWVWIIRKLTRAYKWYLVASWARSLDAEHADGIETRDIMRLGKR